MGDTHRDIVRPKPLPSEAQVERWHRTLMDNPKALAAIRRLRGWSELSLTTFKVGLDGSAVVFPQRSFDGELVQCIRWAPGGKVAPHDRALSGRPRIFYPEPEHFPDGTVWIVEGEPDALSACELRLRGVGIPGATYWPQGAAERFRGRRVLVCLDCDPEGRKNGHKIVGELRALDIDARYVDLDPERSDGYDLTDFLLEALTHDGGLEQARRWLHRLAGEPDD